MSLTIKDIARMAGVSFSTVSRVINNSKPVSEEIRNRVLDVIEETKFRPNAVARGLVKSKSNMLGVIIPDLCYTLFDEKIEGIHKVSKIYGYDFILSLSGRNLDHELHYLNLFREKQTDGIIFASNLKKQHVEVLEHLNTPCVIIGEKSEISGFPTINLDNYTASYEAVSYLIQNGHKEIAMIRKLVHETQEDEVDPLEKRYQGYLQAMKDAGLTVRPEWVVSSGLSMPDGMEAVKKIVESGKLPTALFCVTDRVAIGAMNYLMEIGYHVPDDISFIGFDDIDICMATRPQLSSIGYSANEIGMTATRVLIKLIKGEEVSMHTDVPHHLLIRQSVKSIR